METKNGRDLIYDNLAKSDKLMKRFDVSANEEAKELLRDAAVICREVCRPDVQAYAAAKADLFAANKTLEEAASNGVTYVLSGKWIEGLEQKCDKCREAMYYDGLMINAVLNQWQKSGASLAELCEICNKDYAELMEEIDANDEDAPFSDQIIKYYLDFHGMAIDAYKKSP